MERYRISEVAELIGTSPDTVRRIVDAGEVKAVRRGGQRLIDARDLARYLTAQGVPGAGATKRSARNEFRGIVTRVVKDGVMAQVDIQAGPHRVVSLMSREAAEQLKLAPGVRAVASVKATNVVVELPG